MDYKKAYQEALERAKYLKENTDSVGAKDISYTFEYIFPELRESEDEKIRKEIIEFLIWLKEFRNGGYEPSGKYVIEDMIAWLEKRGDLKLLNNEEYQTLPVETLDRLYAAEKELEQLKQGKQKHSWNEEDREMLDNCLGLIQEIDCTKEEQNWLKSLKDRVQLQPKQEWGEEDEKMFDKLYEILYIYGYSSHPEIDLSSNEAINLIYWLKSIKPNHWKPSEQNIKDLEWCADLVKDKMGVGFHRLQVFIDELKNNK